MECKYCTYRYDTYLTTTYLVTTTIGVIFGLLSTRLYKKGTTIQSHFQSQICHILVVENDTSENLRQDNTMLSEISTYLLVMFASILSCYQETSSFHWLIVG